jgi:hypothetical protein
MNIINMSGSVSGGSQRHVHELEGSVMIAEKKCDPHNHRFAVVTGPATTGGSGHVHDVVFRTDFYEDHYHEFRGKTKSAVRVGDRHVHFLEGETFGSDGHCHDFRAATMIEDPIGEDCGC